MTSSCTRGSLRFVVTAKPAKPSEGESPFGTGTLPYSNSEVVKGIGIAAPW